MSDSDKVIVNAQVDGYILEGISEDFFTSIFQEMYVRECEKYFGVESDDNLEKPSGII